MNQLEEIRGYILPKWNERFADDQKRIKNYFDVHQKEIQKIFDGTITKYLVPAVTELQQKAEWELSYVIIQSLYSSLCSKTYDYEIILSSDPLYVDTRPVITYWRPDFLYQYTEDQEMFLANEMKKQFIRVKPYEIEGLRLALFASYQEEAKYYFQILAKDIWRLPGFQQIKRKETLKILYGEHMGELIELKEHSQEENYESGQD